MDDQKKVTAPHYHTTCRNCEAVIIMGENIYQPGEWRPYEIDGKKHNCPRRPDELPSNQPGVRMDDQ